jgi:hypothetical protein
MKSTVIVLVRALKALAFIVPLALVGLLIAELRHVPETHIVGTVAVPIIAIVLVFKSILALPPSSPEEAEAVLQEFETKPVWMQKIIVLCSLDVPFIIVMAICTGLYAAFGLKHEFIASYRLGTGGLIVFFVLMVFAPILHVLSPAFREIKMQAVLTIAWIFAACAPAEIWHGHVPTLSRIQHRLS